MTPNGGHRFLSDFRNLNGQLKSKPYPFLKIHEILLNLERFQYATSLYLTWVIITYVLANRLSTYALSSYDGESTGTNG